jgi:hypothetical protein
MNERQLNESFGNAFWSMVVAATLLRNDPYLQRQLLEKPLADFLVSFLSSI